MKLARLLLQAFGPFTDTVIDFAGDDGHSQPNFHLIYGLNEAGKSSALRAMTDLRFGIPLRSPDDFLHPSKRLRIAGAFVDAAGQVIGLARRKGRGATLSRCDPQTGEPLDPPEVTRDEQLALSGGLQREEFEAMFGLNHARLRAGGELLLKGEGELGAALFEASAGTRGIAAILAELEADAKALYNPHGRAQSATVNEARRQLDEQRQLWKQAQTRPADWQALHRAHQQAGDALAEVDQALETLRRRDNELTELRTVEPLLRAHDRALAELQALADAPDLAEDAREQRLAAEQALRHAARSLQDAELELSRCAEALAALVIEAPLLEHAEAIERLAAGVEAAARSRVDARQQQALIERTAEELDALAGRVATGESLEQVLDAVPSQAERVALDRHLAEAGRLGERLDGYRSRAAELDQAARNEAEDIPVCPDPAARQTLRAALRGAQALGDPSPRTADLERDIRALDGELRQGLADLGIASAEALRKARPLLDAEIAAARQAWAEIEQAARRSSDEDLRLEGDLEQQRLRQRQLAAAGEVVTAETLRLARERRDQGWSLVRQAYVERRGSPEELGSSFDADRPLPEAFEAAQGEADRQADLLRADAARAAGLEECAARIEAMERRRREIAEELAQRRVRHQEIQARWERRLAQGGLPELDPQALREWQAARQGALDIAHRLERSRQDRERVLAEAAAAGAALVAALQGVGQTPEGAGLSALVDQAARWEKRATAAAAEQGARVRAEQKLRAERERLAGQIAMTETDLRTHAEALQAWHARLFLPPGSTPGAIKARLDELDGLARRAAALAEARFRRAQQQAVIDDFAAQAAGLAVLLGEPGPALPDDFADRLRRRLVTAREQDQQRRSLVRDRERARDTKRRAEAEQQAQSAVLGRLCAAAGVDTVEQLPEREDRAARKRSAQDTLAAQRQQLAQASTHGLDALRERLEGRDAIAIDAARERCRQEILRLEQQQASARRAEEQARRALEAIDASDRAAAAREAMESAAARYRSALRPWARLRLAHGLLQQALNRFRERAQAPMVAAASSYFSLICGGRYPRLVADEADGRPVLRAERDDGARIGVEAMSDGTADQLYLALRLAALELRRASHPQVPLVLDDVLITSDDERVANILRALARFAEGGQVMLFTHHRHLIEVARATLARQTFAIHYL